MTEVDETPRPLAAVAREWRWRRSLTPAQLAVRASRECRVVSTAEVGRPEATDTASRQQPVAAYRQGNVDALALHAHDDSRCGRQVGVDECVRTGSLPPASHLYCSRADPGQKPDSRQG